MGVTTANELKQRNVPVKRVLRSGLSSRQPTEWPLHDVSSDLTVEVGTASFALHKFPLVSRCGKIRKIISQAKDSKAAHINLLEIPGGSAAFELAAKFCYGINVELDLSNIAMLRCAARYLEMTEEFAENNLDLRTEIYLKETVAPDTTNCITVLRHCEVDDLLPAAEENDLINRIITAIAINACKEYHNPAVLDMEPQKERWGNSLAVLNLDFFQRILLAMRSKGAKEDTISKILISYAQNSIQGLETCKGGFSDGETTLKKQRIIVETVVGLIPERSGRAPVPMAFLSGLLKTAAIVSASALCRTGLERRIGINLDQAILEDILIPANSHNSSHSLYDTDSASRIFSVFLNSDEDEGDDDAARSREDGSSPRSPKQVLMVKVSKLMDIYLAEIALDSNLTPSKFIALAELLPDHIRTVYDGLYRAIDIFLKVHPNIKDSERYRLCKSVDCQKLSQEACSHAAQNERLPVQMAVQVLYFEQIRLRNAISGGHDHHHLFPGSANGGPYPQRSSSRVGSGAVSPRDCYASVRRENRELKFEVARMRIRLTDLEKDHVSMKKKLVHNNSARKLLRSLAKKLRKMSGFFRIRAKTDSDARFLFQKRRRHSIS